MSFLTKLLGDPNAKVIKEIQPIIDKINLIMHNRAFDYETFLPKVMNPVCIMPEGFGCV